MPSYSSTRLGYASRYCPRALDHAEAGVPADRRVYLVGIAAHALLQGLGEGRTVESTCAALMERGRIFAGEPEPPLPPDAVVAARDLVERYISVHPIEPSEHAAYEVGLAATASWEPCEYTSPKARYRAILDVLEIADEADEEGGWQVAVARDYKSAWSTDASELDTVQRRGQAVLVWLHYGHRVDIIRREVHNLRTWRVYSEDLNLLGDDVGKLERWRDDLTRTMDALDGMVTGGRRPAAPGGGCYGCPYVLACEDARDYMERAREVELFASPLEQGRAYAVAVATMVALKDRLRATTDEAPVDLDTHYVGTKGTAQRKLKESAYHELAELWRTRGGELDGFARAANLSVSNAEKLAAVVFGADREKRADFLLPLTETYQQRRFGVWRKED